jgi:DNA replication protein DnaC
MTYDIGQLEAFKRQWIFNNSNIPRRFMGMEPADIISRMGSFPNTIDKWLDSALEGDIIKAIGGIGKTGVGLLFDGAPGLGKTTHAVTTLMEFVRRLPEEQEDALKILRGNPAELGYNARPIYYMTFPEFLSRKKALFEADEDSKRNLYLEMEGFHGRAKEDHLNVRVLVLDDLGKEYKGAGFNDASFDEVLRSRYDKGLPTIITTNINRDNWAGQYGEAMGSFAHEAFRRVVLTGHDLRQE